jgi:hypothetical protein
MVAPAGNFTQNIRCAVCGQAADNSDGISSTSPHITVMLLASRGAAANPTGRAVCLQQHSSEQLKLDVLAESSFCN